MNTLAAYLPQDRLRALACGESLPDRCLGSALFADISGFTPLTESLVARLGPRRGAEEISIVLNQVYDALIHALERCGGSVLGFAGDAITCWFDERLLAAGSAQPPALNALAAALAMQSAMQAFPSLALKIAIAAGPARRFVVGASEIQLLDALAGATLARMAEGEHLAQKGEILADEATLQLAGDLVQVIERRVSSESGAAFGVVRARDGAFRFSVEDFQRGAAILQSTIGDIPSSILRPWLLPAVYEREQAGLGAFLTELRSAVALFLRFEGIDYDGDETAEEKLNRFVCRAQEIVVRSGGTLLDLTIGDKGSYSYSAFGAPVAHENDVRRALNAALELRDLAAELPFITGIQIGVSRGVMRTGAYGGRTRRAYGVLGDEVNLAARLMQSAAPGQIIVSGRVQYATAEDFVFRDLPPITVKGKAQPITAFLLYNIARRKNYRLLDPYYTLPMVSRQAELVLIDAKLTLTLQGQSQVIGISGEAGIGKSRLTAEIIRLAQRRGFTGYGAACQSDRLSAPYHVWSAILRAFFDVDAEGSLEEQANWLRATIECFAPQRLSALPLIARAIGLHLEENDFTRSLNPKDRKSTLEASLVDCVRGAAEAARLGKSALLFVLEDVHWIDALSHDLLEELAQALTQQPVCFVMVYRPPELERIAAPRLERLPQFTKIELRELNRAEAWQVMSARLAQMYPDSDFQFSFSFIEKLLLRAQGNPFYLEELLNYLHDQGFDPGDPNALEKADLPDSLHTLILSRIDQLSEYEKTALRVACIIGRFFRVDWLRGYYPGLGELPQVKTALDTLRALDITPLNTPEPDLAYLFKHIITHEATYASLSFAMRAELHERLALYLERETQNEGSLLDAIAFHYGRSENVAKQREYWLKAGDAAQKSFANEAAVEYYGKVLPLLQTPAERISLYWKRGAVLELMGDSPRAEADYRAALEIAQQSQDAAAAAQAQLTLGKFYMLFGEYPAARSWLAQAQEGYTALNDQPALGLTLAEIGQVILRQGENPTARTVLLQALALSRAADHQPGIMRALNGLAIIAAYQGDYSTARSLFTETLEISRASGAQREIAVAQMNLGGVAYEQNDLAAARALMSEALVFYRTAGNKHLIAVLLSNLGTLESTAQNLDAAQPLLEESLELRRRIGDKRGIVMSLNALGGVLLERGEIDKACAFYEEALTLGSEMGYKGDVWQSQLGLGNAIMAASQFDPAALAQARQYIQGALRLCLELEMIPFLPSILISTAVLAVRSGDARRAARWLGAVNAASKTYSASLLFYEHRLQQQVWDEALAALGETAFQSAWVDGGKLSLDEAVRMALDSAAPDPASG